MPWSPSDADEHKEGLTQSEKEQWAEVANSVREQCLADGGSEDECDARAIRQANGVVGNSVALHHLEFNTADYRTRTEHFMGRRHVVAPVVLMVEGVHHGSQGPTLYTRDELSKFPPAWNGRPVPVLHPEDEGGPIPANDPAILEQQSVGWLFNVHYLVEDGLGKLRGEVWVDEQQAHRVDPQVLEDIRSGRGMEVSTGVFNDPELVGGEWNGEEYLAIARDLRPDHLALLPGERGACSWEDGCGIRANKEGGMNRRTKPPTTNETHVNNPSFEGTESSDWSAPSLSDFDVESSQWDDLSQQERSRVANHYLIGSASAENFEDLAFPVVNPSSGSLNENALRAVISGRGAQLEGVDANVRARARRKAYNLLNEHFDADLDVPSLDDLKEQEPHTNGCGCEGCRQESKSHPLQTNQVGEGYHETLMAVQQKLDSMDGGGLLHFLEELYDDRVIYRVENMQSDENQLFERTYTVQEDGTIEFGDDPQRVVRRVSYEPVGDQPTNQSDKGDSTMGKVDELIQNQHTHFDENDRDWLSNLNEEQLAKMEPAEPTNNGGEGDEGKTVSREEAVAALQESCQDTETFLGLLPAGLREQMRHGLNLHSQKRQECVERITNNSDVWTKEELEGKDIDELEKIAHTVKPQVNHAPMGGGSPPATHGSQAPAPLLPTDVQSASEQTAQ